MADLLKGKPVAIALKKWIKNKIQAEKLDPSLAIIMVGDNPASKVYVGHKLKAANEVGIRAELVRFDSQISQSALIREIASVSKSFNGLIVQLPLPDHISEDNIIQHLPLGKDVDGFTPENLGLLARSTPRFISATPLGILFLLHYYGIFLEGKNVVVVGRSNIVGTPMALLVSRRFPWANATVTMCHSRSRNIEEHLQNADIVIVAVGRKHWLKPEMVHSNMVVVDVGIHVDDNGKLTGDVDPTVHEIVKAITPVPGGVGPMTVATLLFNVYLAAALGKGIIRDVKDVISECISFLSEESQKNIEKIV